MASSSPSEFLTFYRRLATSQGLRQRATRPFTARQFHASTTVRASLNSAQREKEIDGKHATQKLDDQLDVQSREAAKGQESRAKDDGSAATRQKDEAGSVAKTKKDFPEAPTPAIGMQDERGGKGNQ